MYPLLNYSSHRKSLFVFGKYHKNGWIFHGYVSLPECTHLSPVREEVYNHPLNSMKSFKNKLESEEIQSLQTTNNYSPEN